MSVLYFYMNVLNFKNVTHSKLFANYAAYKTTNTLNQIEPDRNIHIQLGES